MKLSEMTTARLAFKRTQIDKILAKRRRLFAEALVANHKKLLRLHKKSGGRIFRGTFAELLNFLGDAVYGRQGHPPYAHFAANMREDPDANSIFGECAYKQDEHPFEWVDHNEVGEDVVREWMLALDGNPLNVAEARALLRVAGVEVTE
jgi:hypothetical protein